MTFAGSFEVGSSASDLEPGATIVETALKGVAVGVTVPSGETAGSLGFFVPPSYGLSAIAARMR